MLFVFILQHCFSLTDFREVCETPLTAWNTLNLQDRCIHTAGRAVRSFPSDQVLLQTTSVKWVGDDFSSGVIVRSLVWFSMPLAALRREADRKLDRFVFSLFYDAGTKVNRSMLVQSLGLCGDNLFEVVSSVTPHHHIIVKPMDEAFVIFLLWKAIMHKQPFKSIEHKW